MYIPGKLNKAVDCLYRYHKNDNYQDDIPDYDMVNTDMCLDPDGDDLPQSRLIEIWGGCILRRTRQRAERKARAEGNPIPQDRTEAQAVEAEQYAQH